MCLPLRFKATYLVIFMSDKEKDAEATCYNISNACPNMRKIDFALKNTFN